METTLRPMSLGEILDRTATIYRKNFLVLAGISAIYAGVTLLIGTLNVLLIHFLGWGMGRNAHLMLVELLSTIAVGLMYILAAIPIAAVNRAVSWISMGQKTSIRDAYKSVLGRAFTYLALMTILVVLIYLPYALWGIGYFAIFTRNFANGQIAVDDPSRMTALFILVLFALILMPALIAYMIWMLLRYALAIPACVIEELSPRAAMQRSNELSKGARGRIFVLYLLVSVIQMGLTFLFSGPFLVLTFKQAMKDPTQISLGIQIAQQFAVFAVKTFVTPIFATGFILFYYDQRIRKEGFDIEWMMQTAGLNETASSAPDAVAPPPLVAPPAEGANE